MGYDRHGAAGSRRLVEGRAAGKRESDDDARTFPFPLNTNVSLRFEHQHFCRSRVAGKRVRATMMHRRFLSF
jgi:hypothetical protein